jgi:hypothetical protein
MKRLITGIVLFITLSSSNTFGQTELPVSFKTVNGKGMCGTAAEIRVYFTALPAQLPTIAQIRSEQRDVPGIVIGNTDASDFDKKGYVSYCVLSGDILPSGKLSIRFHYEDSGLDYWISETRSKHPNMGH